MCGVRHLAAFDQMNTREVIASARQRYVGMASFARAYSSKERRVITPRIVVDDKEMWMLTGAESLDPAPEI